MRYLMTNVRIYKGTNSRGDYHWMTVNLFNDRQPQANPNRLPGKARLNPIVVDAFLACKDALTQNANGWMDVDMSKVPDEGLTAHHLELVRPETVVLDGFYQEVYSRDYTDSKGVIHPKGSVRTGSNGLPLPPVNTMVVYVEYFMDNDFGKVEYIPVETKEQLANFMLQTRYVKLQQETSAAPGEEFEPEQSAEDIEAKRKALEEQLAALS